MGSYGAVDDFSGGRRRGAGSRFSKLAVPAAFIFSLRCFSTANQFQQYRLETMLPRYARPTCRLVHGAYTAGRRWIARADQAILPNDELAQPPIDRPTTNKTVMHCSRVVRIKLSRENETASTARGSDEEGGYPSRMVRALFVWLAGQCGVRMPRPRTSAVQSCAATADDVRPPA